MAPEEPPPAPDDGRFVWLLLEPGSRPGHRMTMGVFSSRQRAQAALRQTAHGLWMWRVPLDQLDRI